MPSFGNSQSPIKAPTRPISKSPIKPKPPPSITRPASQPATMPTNRITSKLSLDRCMTLSWPSDFAGLMFVERVGSRKAGLVHGRRKNSGSASEAHDIFPTFRPFQPCYSEPPIWDDNPEGEGCYAKRVWGDFRLDACDRGVAVGGHVRRQGCR